MNGSTAKLRANNTLATALLLITVAVSVAAQATKGQESCSQVSEAMGAVNGQSGFRLPAGAHLRANPIPDLADDLIFLEAHGKPVPGARITPFCFYLVTLSPYFLNGHAIESVTVQIDETGEWIAAVNTETRATYLLVGSSDPIGGFNDLIKTLHLEVRDSEFALALFDSYLRLVRGQEFRSRVVPNDMKLESVALEDFRMRIPAPGSRAAFEKWWNNVPHSTRNGLTPPRVARLEDGFVVTYFFYDRGNLWKQTLHIGIDGTLNEEKAKRLVSAD